MIRAAEEKDIERINELLYQVHAVHAEGRPDIFKKNAKKYETEEILALLKDGSTRIFVYAGEDDRVLGYAFCQLKETKDSKNMMPLKHLYIDDICVDEKCRRRHIGADLYAYVKDFAREIGCYHVILNVWELNPGARAFYESLGMKPLKTEMEEIL